MSTSNRKDAKEAYKLLDGFLKFTEIIFRKDKKQLDYLSQLMFFLIKNQWLKSTIKMEFFGEIIGQFIAEYIFGFAFKMHYKIFIRPILITLGFINFSIKRLFIKDIKSYESTTYDELEKAGGDLIIGSIVIAILLLIVFMILYLGFYIFNN